MPRSLRVQQDCIHKVKLALSRNGFPSQRSLAEDVGFALATVSNFLTGKPVDYTTFEELCRKLGLNWREISTLELEFSAQDLDRDPEHRPPNRDVDLSSIEPDSDTSPQYPNGAVPIGSPYYLERTAVTAQIDREIRKPGALVRIKAPQEMGKTSLLMRVLDTAKGLGYQTVSLNIAQVDATTLSDLDRFLRWLCANVARQLQLKPMLAEYWDEDIGSKISCSAYFQDYLLAQIDTPLVLALDEANRIFEHPQIAKDFFPLLRFWYEEAKTLPIWQKLRLIVVHSTEIYIPLQINQSPFNVGLPIQLHNFSQTEVQQLARSYGIDWEDGVAAGQLRDLVGGHPALVNLALYHLSREDLTLAQLLKTAPTASGIYHHHLQRHWVSLEAQPELLLALNAVMNATEPVDLEPIVAYKLSSMGSVRLLDDKAIPACELYRLFFLKNNNFASQVAV
ncbi:AAA-like domain-containing protein [Chamaesiphon sp. VAR_69_metabat_338]|uniref:AAA-like domain-containing protein n=1 Tax=Chamaesiphon sp. VAR_69_metabat_338 TaxID=2964704 RepID=UPI00286DC951|nr:AAA-like domain-containing protein [Chamaesiphon sp. VAR_69_metabat_338]